MVVIDGGNEIFFSSGCFRDLPVSADFRLLWWPCELCACENGGTSVICRFGSVIFCAAIAADGNVVSADTGDECAFCIVVYWGKRSTIGSDGSNFSNVKSMQLYSVACVGKGIKSLGLPKIRDVRLYMHSD